MLSAVDPFRFVLTAVAGWMNQHQQMAIDYLREENRVLREQLGDRRLRLNDEQRRRLPLRPKGWAEASGGGGHPGHARDLDGLAPKAHRR